MQQWRVAGRCGADRLGVDDLHLGGDSARVARRCCGARNPRAGTMQNVFQLWVYLSASRFVVADDHTPRPGCRWARVFGRPCRPPIRCYRAQRDRGLAQRHRHRLRNLSLSCTDRAFPPAPATVALAVPLVRVVSGAAVARPAMGVAWALGAGPDVMTSSAPKSVTTPVAMAIARDNDGSVGDPDGGDRRDFGDPAYERARVEGLCRSGFAAGLVTMGSDRAGVSRERAGRDVCRAGNSAERAGDISAAARLVSAVAVTHPVRRDRGEG